MGCRSKRMPMRCWEVHLASSLLVLWIAASALASDDRRRLVCYYSNWAVYRPGLAKFTPENIDPFLCTHLIYAFAGMNKDYELKPFDSYNDLQLGNYKKFTNLKTYNPKLKVMVAVGGWNEGSKRFSKMVESASTRLRFVRGALSFLRKHGFDGLDLDWEYPGSRDGGRDSDKEGYTRLVKELREAFDSESLPSGKSRLLLTMAVPAGKQYIDKGYDVKTLARHLDFLNLLTYDYHTAHEAQVNHHAPLGEEPGLEDWSPNKQLNVEWTVRYYLDLGCDPEKLVLGIPTYGRSFTLADPEETEIGAPAEGPGEKGDATREGGYLAYYEICHMIQDQEWELEAPYPDIMGPYAYKGNQWVGFDDEDIILEKVKFIVRHGLGGGMVWTLDNDDFRGRCYGEQSPLISTLKSALERGDGILLSDAAPTTVRTPKQEKKKTTSAPFTTPDPGPPFECEDEGFFNHPTDCRKYFWCLDSGPSDLGLVAHAFTCPSGLHFNKKRDACDYAANVACRPKKETKTTTTTRRATVRQRPKPRTRKTTSTSTTTTTTTTTTTQTPPVAVDGQSLAELLNLLQQLGGINQIHDRLHGRESAERNATLTYVSPVRMRTREPASEKRPVDPFLQYASPVRTRTPKLEEEPKEEGGGFQPRGPQFHAAPEAPTAEEVPLHDEHSDSDDDVEEADRFPFVYHTPSRQRSTPDLDPEVEDVVTVTSVSPPPPRRRVVVTRVRPIPGEAVARRQTTVPAAAIPATTSSPPRRNNYALAQTVGVRRQVRPANGIEEEEEGRTSAPPKRRITTTQPRTEFRGPPPRRELIVLPTGKPAVPATTRRYHRYDGTAPESVARGPGLALLPDGGVTCLRRGVHPHPKNCSKFVVCVPSSSAEGGDLDGFIHDCPPGTTFVDLRGRCTAGNDCQSQ